VTAAKLEDSAIGSPPVGAGLDIVIVPLTGVVDPPTTVVGLIVKETTVGALIFRAPVTFVVPS